MKMRRHARVGTILLLCTSPACDRSEDGTCWSQVLGSEHGNTVALAIALHGDDALYVAGRTTGPFSGGPYSNSEAFLSKYDTAGASQWTVQFGSPDPDEASAVAIAPDGGVYVAGRTSGAVDGMSGATARDVFLAKFSADGERLWIRQLDLGGTDYLEDMTIDGHGRIVIVGYTEQPSGTSTPDSWPFVAKLDATGQVEWSRQMDGPSPGRAETVAIGPAGDIYVAGITYEYNLLRGDVWTSRYTADGTQLWVSSRDAFDGHERARAITADSEGGARVATWSGDKKIHVVHYDALGAERAALDIADPAASFVRFVHDDAGELGVYVAGERRKAEGHDCDQDALSCPGGLSVDTDLYVAEYDLDGQREWFKTSPIGEDEFDQRTESALALTADSRGHVYVAGTREGVPYTLGLIAGFCLP